MVAVSVVLVYKSTHVVSLAHGQIMAFGALILYFAFVVINLPFVLAVGVALVCAVVIGWLIERFAMRPLIGESELTAFLNTFAVYLMMDGLFQLSCKGSTFSFFHLLPHDMFSVFEVPFPITQLVSFGISILVFVGLALFFQYTKMGLEMRATAEDHQLAQCTGISVQRIFSSIWGISGLVAAIAGIALAMVIGITPFLPYIVIKGLVVALVGGLESMPGAILGGLILGVLENVSAGYLDPFLGGGVKEVAAYVLVLFILLIKPYGLFGLRRIERI